MFKAPSLILKANALMYDPHGADRDCGDFDSQQEAQDFYEAAGGPDSDRIDWTETIMMV